MSEDPSEPTTTRHALLRRVAEPWTVVVLVTALFHFVRGAPVDGVFFLAMTLLLVADALGWVRFGSRQIQLPRLSTLAGLAIVLGVLLVLAPRHGFVEGIIVSAIGASVLVGGWAVGGHRVPRSDALRRAVILFTAVGVIGCIIEISSFLLGLASARAAFEHPSVSMLLDPWLDTLEGRIVFTTLWLATGIWFVQRARGVKKT